MEVGIQQKVLAELRQREESVKITCLLLSCQISLGERSGFSQLNGTREMLGELGFLQPHSLAGAVKIQTRLQTLPVPHFCQFVGKSVEGRGASRWQCLLAESHSSQKEEEPAQNGKTFLFSLPETQCHFSQVCNAMG